MKAMVWTGVLGTIFFAAGCSSDSTSSSGPGATGTARLAITRVPADVACIRVRVQSSSPKDVDRSFDVTAGQSTEFVLGGLPLGLDTFSADAYPDACSSVDASTTVATWLSDAVTARIVAGSATDVNLAMHAQRGTANVSVDFPDAAPTSVGCADGTREEFTDQATFPAIAACSGGWDGNGESPGFMGVFPVPLRTTSPGCSENGNSGANPRGQGCSASDLCQPGWHLCTRGELLPRVQAAPNFGSQTDGCAAITWPADSFFVAAIGSTGCGICIDPNGTADPATCTNSSCTEGCPLSATGATNDFFGCGTQGTTTTLCGDVDMSAGEDCQAVGAGWYCGPDHEHESQYLTHDPAPAPGVASAGGVLCCGPL